jgi:molybdenum cofactor cytidylyltransferase
MKAYDPARFDALSRDVRDDPARLDSLPHGACGMISAIILAAGQSKRMGQPKMLLPWGQLTVIEHVVATFMNAGVEDILVVTGGTHKQVEKALDPYPVRKLQNRDFAVGEMLASLQYGLRDMPDQAQAALIGLGDQPQILERTIRLICEAYGESRSWLIVPSFRMRRGHPWLVARPLWKEILALSPSETPRDFLNYFADKIQYVNLDTPTILADLDTPQDYQNSRP